MTKTLFFDTETWSAGANQYRMPPEQFVRLGQYAWGDGPIQYTTNLDELKQVISEADYIVGHNIVHSDLTWIYGNDSMEPLQLALQNKIVDTFILATLLTPAPYSYTNRKGHTFYGASAPEQAMKWYALDNLTYQFNLPGKMGDLKTLAKPFQPEGTLEKDYEYGLIPLDDPEFLEYAEGDVVAVRALYYYMLEQVEKQKYPGDYIWREMTKWSINEQISKNGVLVDVAEAHKRVAELEAERDRIMPVLVEKYGFPTKGKQPWKSNEGKQAILDALKTYGITPKHPKWELTAKGAPSFGGKVMLAVTEGTEAEELGRALATLQGQRSLAQLALDSVMPDGKAHPSIMCMQRSGRTSVLKPALTVWTARGPGAVEKRYFIAEPGHKMVSMDYSAADARAVAAVSGDREFMKRFDEGVDAHDLTGVIFFGEENYYKDRARLRNLAKIGGHSLAYRTGAGTLAKSLGVTVGEASTFKTNYEKTYYMVTAWQKEVTQEGERYGYVTNSWGRRMPVEKDRSYTQSAALIGQSTTTEVLYDGLMRIANDKPEVLRWVRMPVHDEIILVIPDNDIDWGVEYVRDKMSMVFDPQTVLGLPVEFTLSAGEPANNWFEATHD